MRRIAKIVFVACVLLVPRAMAQHDGYWRQFPSQRNENRDCALFENQGDLEDALNSLNWNMNATPVVDWTNDSAIVIAPGVHYNGFQIAFFDIEWDGDTKAYDLNWGWEKLPESSNNGNSHTEGSSAPVQYGLIVVSFKRWMHANNNFVCNELPAE